MERIAIIVDDDKCIRDYLTKLLSGTDLKICSFKSFASAISAAESIPQDLVDYISSDFRIKGESLNGIDFLCQLGEMFPSARRLVFSAHGQRVERQAKSNGYDYIQKARPGYIEKLKKFFNV